MQTKGAEGLLYDSTPAQRRITLTAGLAGAALAVVCAGLAGAEWSGWQWGVVLFAAFDLVGGVAAMCLPPAIRKMRPPDQPLRPILFAAFHVHPLLLAFALPDMDWAALSVIYASGLLGVLLVTITQPEFRSSAALASCAVSLTLIAIVGMPPAIEWLAPAFVLKIAGSHAVPPEPH